MTTSEPRECFVYLQLPGTLEVVTCGRYAWAAEVGRFVYGRSYLAHPGAVELDRAELVLRPGEFQTARAGGIFGALRDASPDAWGRRVIERALGRSDLSEIDFLLHSPDDRAGALSFGLLPEPPSRPPRFNQVLQLEALVAAARRVEEGREPLSDQVLDLVHPGSSLGGARPKNVVEDADGLWVAKFASRSDRWNNAAAEAAMLMLAGECGIEVPKTRRIRVAGSDVLLVQRFDRLRVPGGYLRHRMVSALTVLQAEEQDRARWSYSLLADELRRWTRDPDADLRSLFRRMVFNALISNIDDHPRNHALIADESGWRLSPAYDLTPFPQVGMERDLAMSVGRSRRATRANLLSEHARFRLSQEEAEAIIDGQRAIVSARWRQAVRACGGSAQDVALLAPAFDNPGFDFT